MNPVQSTSPRTPDHEPTVTCGSLRTLHVVFVGFCAVLCAGLCVWSLVNYFRHGNLAAVLIAIGALALSVALVIYGHWFLNKLRRQDIA